MYNPVEMWCLIMIVIVKYIVITESMKIFSSLNIRCPEIGSSDAYDVLIFLLLLT